MSEPKSPSPALLALLRCPACRRGELEYRSSARGELVCRACGQVHTVQNGVPRLARDPYVASFGRQWNRYDVERPAEDEAVFRVKTGIDAAELAGQAVLDAGCGGGRYAHLLARHGANVLGVDLSDAVEKAAAACRPFPNALIVQADLLDLPVAPQVFDLVFSIGVLHHSPDPRQAFAQIARAVKPGGRLAVWLYRRNSLPQELLNSGLRALTTRMPPRMLELGSAGLAVVGSVPVLNQALNKVINFSNHTDWTLRVCDNFDWYAPRYQSHHTQAELRSWFAEEGFTDLVDLTPARSGRIYDWAFRNNLIIGSGVNVLGTRTSGPPGT